MINLENETLLRIYVMSQIQHPESYYINALESQGVDAKSLSHAEISVFKAAMLVVEADTIIEAGKNYEQTKID